MATASIAKSSPAFLRFAGVCGSDGALRSRPRRRPLVALIHGVHDLALVIVPALAHTPDLSAPPNQLDPRGLLAFGL